MENRIEKLVVSQALELEDLRKHCARIKQDNDKLSIRLGCLSEENMMLLQNATLEKLHPLKLQEGFIIDEKISKIQKLEKNENFLILENVRLNAKIAELECGVIVVDEEDCETPKVVKNSGGLRIVAILAKYNDDFHTTKMNQGADIRGKTQYIHIKHINQLKSRDKYDEILKGSSWSGVCKNSEYDLSYAFDVVKLNKYLETKTCGF